MKVKPTGLTVSLKSPSPSPDFMGDAYVVQHSRCEVGQSLNLPSGPKVSTKRADGIRDDTADSCTDGQGDHGDGLRLHFSGVTRSDVVVERARTINLGEVSWCSDDREDRRMGIVIVGCNPICDHLMGVE
jgi:hypothetical protein